MTDVAAELAAVRRMLEDHERRLYPIAPGDLPRPTTHVTDQERLGMNGPRWKVSKDWTVLTLDNPDSQDCVYLSRGFPLTGDIEGLELEEARRLAHALLAAINYYTDDLAKRRGA